MKFSPWLPDTIARRFAVTEVLAVAVTLALVGLFRSFGGAWSHEPLERSSLLNEAADIVRMIDARQLQRQRHPLNFAPTGMPQHPVRRRRSKPRHAAKTKEHRERSAPTYSGPLQY